MSQALAFSSVGEREGVLVVHRKPERNTVIIVQACIPEASSPLHILRSVRFT